MTMAVERKYAKRDKIITNCLENQGISKKISCNLYHLDSHLFRPPTLRYCLGRDVKCAKDVFAAAASGSAKLPDAVSPTPKKGRITMRTQTRPFIIDQADLPWEGWEDADVAASSAIRWKLLTAGERTGSAGLVTGIAEIPPGERLLLHHHEPEETYYIVQGHGRLEIDARAADVGPGCAAYIPPNARHALHCTGEEPLILVFSFARDRFDQVDYQFDE